jgi:pilus assembly protein CpaF
MKAQEAMEALAGSLRDQLLHEAGDGAGQDVGGQDDLEERIRALVDREAGPLDEAARADLVGRISKRSFGLGPLESLLADPEVDEVMVNGTGPASVFVERAGRVEPADVRFGSEAELRHTVERILAPLGRRVDEAQPLCDARLPWTVACSRSAAFARGA